MTAYPEITDQTLLPPLPDRRALNGMKHGILSELVPSWERAGYADHVQAVRGSLGANTYLQQRLVDRAALALWRLDRVARWEAESMEADQRRFADNIQARDVEFSFPVLDQRPIDARGLKDSLKALAELTGEGEQALLAHPDTVELIAADLDSLATAWAAVRSGEGLASFTQDQNESVGVALLSALQETWNVDASRVARLLAGRKPTRDEVEAVADWDWRIESGEVAVLLKEAVRVAGEGLSSWLIKEQYEASGKAGKIRTVNARLPVLLAQEQARAVEPDQRRLEKVARYEAHLERVLYRALKELRELEATPNLADLTQNE